MKTAAERIAIKKDGQARPYHAYVDGKILKNKVGIGRRFALRHMAYNAALVEINKEKPASA